MVTPLDNLWLQSKLKMWNLEHQSNPFVDGRWYRIYARNA